MKFGKKGLLVVASLSLFALSACGKSAKETVVSSTESILNAKQMESSGSISIKLDSNAKDMKPEDKAAIDMLKNISITVDSKTDKDAKKDEITIGANIKTDAVKMDISIPMLMDEGKKALYVKANNVKSLLQLAGIPGDSFSTLEGKVIKMDMKDLGEVDTKESTKIQEKVQKSLLDAIKALPEDNFTKEKDVYTVKLTGKDLKAVIEKVFDEMSTMKNFTGTKQEIADFKKELEGANLGKSSVSLIYTMDGTTIKKQDAAIHFEAKNPKDEKETFKFDMNIHSDIKSIDKPIKFTFDTSEKNIVPMDDLQKMIGEFMNQFMMNGEMDGGEVTPVQPAPTEPAA
ncbi:hypothetical protein IEE_05136 [Bacillus cereus BAG5X1-1]|uniref:Lipoprotein n=1 Tax=Bacillus cereus BAG5X1-1 TaxID=1053189 RepID=J8A338_BACCE|nr:hypothetical protein [Bacillus cereus]EJQ37577.1 hypothetical protein IEE_05136 [Bacillus cereus BAG5X1-1]